MRIYRQSLTHAQTEEYRDKWTRALLDMDLVLIDELQRSHNSAGRNSRNASTAVKSRGVLLMGAGNMVSLAVTAVQLLRRTGCQLPIEFAYMHNEVAEEHLTHLRSHNITPINFYTTGIASFNWGKEELRLGAPKPFAVLASSFDELLFIDPDIYTLRDPTYLFETAIFRRYGAIFWPDFPATTKANPIWKITDQKYTFEREFESGAMVIDKQKVIRGLRLAAHFCSNADFYFRFIWGDKDAFRWGFKASNTPYFLNPNYVVSVGVAVSIDNPRGNVSLTAENELPRGSWYCGQNMLQMDFLDKVDPSREELSEFVPTPLFLHANGIKKYYKPDIPPFQIVQKYKSPGDGRTIDDLQAGRMHWIGMLLGQNHCMRMEVEGGLELEHYDFMKRYPGVNEAYMQERNKEMSIKWNKHDEE
ncbi:hypothetical protein HDU83_008139 [Entophlyctis luteolus]|nr:hypothetical protein HDU83_008139 [Entophlyctis luteolus]KAJ3391431.1 hypothetical protein HDU84_005990 [Entophlyctis sp. JEL0112]